MTSRNSDKKSEDIIPDTIFDPKCQKTYIKGKFLGKVFHSLILLINLI